MLYISKQRLRKCKLLDAQNYGGGPENPQNKILIFVLAFFRIYAIVYLFRLKAGSSLRHWPPGTDSSKVRAVFFCFFQPQRSSRIPAKNKEPEVHNLNCATAAVKAFSAHPLPPPPRNSLFPHPSNGSSALQSVASEKRTLYILVNRRLRNQLKMPETGRNHPAVK